MARLRIYQVDAFTGRLFSGNPAAVVPLEKWLDDRTLLAIANENNLSETAFFIRSGIRYPLRWFTPTSEVKLCGHATLATAFLLLTEIEPSRRSVSFDTSSGELSVEWHGDRLQMSFPRWGLGDAGPPPAALAKGLSVTPARVRMVDSRDTYMVVLASEAEVLALRPDFKLLESLHPATVVVTAPGTQSDCVCRYFAPSYGVPEDPGTGSIHCALVPYWAERLGKTSIHSRQLSARGAEFFCECRADTTLIAGRAVKYLEGFIDV